LDESQAILFLKEIPLFRRIMARDGVPAVKAHDDIKLLLPHLKVREMIREEIVFGKPGFVNIVINGRVVLRYH
jgi:hypothetical protein